MASKVLKSEPLFRELNGKGGLDIEAALQQFALRQGVGCDGIIHGLKYVGGTPNGNFDLSVETIDSVDQLVLRDCNTGAVVLTFAAGNDPQALTKVYRATVVGENGAITSTTVAKNTIGAVVPSYSAEGVYLFTLAGAFTVGKTTVHVTNQTATGGVIFNAELTSANVVTIRSFAADTTTPADAIGAFSLEIIVDPA